MKLFREYYSFTWWQVVLFKLFLFVTGIIVGTYFADFFRGWYTVLITLFVVLMGYFSYAWVGNRI